MRNVLCVVCVLSLTVYYIFDLFVLCYFREHGREMPFAEKSGYTPDINIEYVDYMGRLLTPKEVNKHTHHHKQHNHPSLHTAQSLILSFMSHTTHIIVTQFVYCSVV